MIGARAIAHQPVLRQLTTGVRARKRRVGYLGSEAALTDLHNGDPLPSGWSAVWSSGAVVVSGNNVTIDHYRIYGSVVFQGNNPTMTNCVIHCNPTDIFGVTINGSGHGVLTVTDTTVIGDPSGASPQVNGISSDSGLVARRCDVSRTGDGIHMNAQSNLNNAIISQCYVHDQGFVDELQHCDGIQIFNDSGGFFTVEHCYVASSPSTLGTPMNSAMTCGTPTNDTTALATPVINNNYFEAGLYRLRLNYRLHNITVTNNDIGPLQTGEFGLYDVITPVATWSGNRDASGTLIGNPNPVATPTIKETLQTTDGQLSTQVLSTTAGTTLAGDIILVVYATDNNAAPAPTSTAGSLTQIGTDAVNGDGNGLLRVYSVPVASNGSKDVTIPAAGGFDIMGAVFVLSGNIEVEGFVKTNYNPSINSFVTPAATFAGSKDLLLALLLNTSGRTFDLSSSGLTQRANPKCLPFSALTVGSAIMSSAGTTPTYTVTMDNAAKPAAVIIGLQNLL